jgi:CubicO group peptidase (beta-lactamase class C family)
MKLSICSLSAIVLAYAACSQAATLAAPPSRQVRPLRLAEPVDAIITDLESYLPEYMRREKIPGVAIALIHGGEIVWTEGFGVTNTITAKPVTPDTLFEVASNSKVMTAYVALRLVDQGKLSLDEPLNAYLSQPWLPPTEHRNAITLRHVLSHSSGLGANIILSRDTLFTPGDGYYYSGIGFMYLQEVIEQMMDQSFEAVAQEMLFGPLGMSSSSFVSAPEITARTANGHLRAAIPALLFTVPCMVSVVLVGTVGLIILWIRTGQWRPGWRKVIGASVVAYVLSLLPALILLGRVGLLEFVWMIAACGLILSLTFALALFAGRIVILRLSPDRPRRKGALSLVLGMAILAGLALLVSGITNVPVPKWPPAHANAAGTVRATAGDLAAFLIELADSQLLSAEMATQLQTPQVTLSRNLSWGAGPGIMHSNKKNALWHWGQHLDFQSAMIIYPASHFGVAVCTNSDLLNPDVAIDIAHRALGGEIEPIRRAIHLEFNYREGD